MGLDRPNVMAAIDLVPKPEDKRFAMKVDSDLDTVTGAINKGVEPDWRKTEEPKYCLWFRIVKKASGGFGLSLDVVYYDNTVANVGARRRFFSPEAARHAWENFQPLFEQEFFGNQ